MEKLFFNASMPQSGSELLQVILHQNPEIYASATSPLLEFMYGARSNFGLSEVKSQPHDMMKYAFNSFCKAGAQAYCEAITNRPYFIDKNRGWGHMAEFSKGVFGEQNKTICMVRDIRQIIAHMEKVYRSSQEFPDHMDNPSEMRGLTIANRVNNWVSNQPVGLAMERVLDLVDRKVEGVMFVRYEDLTTNPEKKMKEIYNHLEIPYFKHDFENIVKEVVEDDTMYGPYGSHKVHKTLKPYANNFREYLPQAISDELVRWADRYQKLFYTSTHYYDLEKSVI